jgi:hypothetical protein
LFAGVPDGAHISKREITRRAAEVYFGARVRELRVESLGPQGLAFFIIHTVPGGDFALTKTPGGSVTPLMAATLAHFALLVYAPSVRPKIALVPLADTSGRGDDDRPVRDIMTAPF